MKKLLLIVLFMILLTACGSQAEEVRPGMGYGNDGMMNRHHAQIPAEYAGLTSPIPADEASLERGAELYAMNCASCHGDGGMGDGPAGAALDPVPSPIAHTSQMMADDYLYWRISEGGVPFSTSMPPWKLLDEQSRWDMINYVRALDAGTVQPGLIERMRDEIPVGMTLESITGWRDLNQTYLLDLSDDAVPQYVLPHDSNHKQLSQEFTLSATSGRLDWLAGIFYMAEENSSTVGDELFLFGGIVAANFRKTLDNDTDSLAFFAQGTYNFTEQFSLTLGGRWTEEDKEVDVVQYFVAPGPETGNPGDFPGTPGTLIPLWNTSNVEANGTPSDVTFSEFTPKVALEYRQSDDLLWYLSYTEGFKSGGWNARVTDPRDFTLFNPETVASYEAGLKSEFVDNRLRANLTLFRADYDDFIITALNEQGRFVTINAAETRIQGFEAELLFRATANLDLFGNVGTMDGEYLKLEGADFPITNEVKRTPRASYQLGFNWTIPMPSLGASFFTTATFSHQDTYYNGLKNAPVELAPEQDLLDFLLLVPPQAVLIHITDAKPRYVYVDRIHPDPKRLLHMITNGIGHALRHRINACAILHNNMDFDVDILSIVVHRNPARGFARDRGHDPIGNILWRKTHDAIGLQGGMIGNASHCGRGDMYPAQ